MVQHSLTVMLELAEQGAISMEKIVERMCPAPAELFQVKNADFCDQAIKPIFVSSKKNPGLSIKTTSCINAAGRPLEGQNLNYKVQYTLVNGKVVYDKGRFNSENHGELLTFKR